MPLNVKDFTPIKSKGTLFKSGRVQALQEVIQEANAWMRAQNTIEVISVETVVLPNIHEKDEEGSMDTELYTGGDSPSNWYQLIRVWYKEEA